MRLAAAEASASTATSAGTTRFAATSPLGGGPTRSGDLLLGGAGELVRRHLHGNGDLALAEHLHELVLANRTLGDELVDADGAALGEQLRDGHQVHDLVFGTEPVGEALELGQPH